MGKDDVAGGKEPPYELPDESRPTSAAPTEQQLERELPAVAKLDYSPAPPQHDPYAAWRVRNYRFYAVSYSLAVVGGQIQFAAVDWDLYERTKDPMWLGWLGFAQFLPTFLLSLPAGHVADTFSRKRVLLFTQLMLAVWGLVMAGLSWWAPHDASWFPAMVLAVLFLNGVTLTFARPSRSSILPNIVPKTTFSNAVTWNSSMFEVASMVGPAIGGLVILHSTTMAYVLNSCFLLACFAMTLPLPDVRAAGASGERRAVSIQSIVAGLKFVVRTRLLVAAMTLDLFAVLLGGATYLLPIFARDILGVGSLGYGILRAAPAVGAFTMAMIVAHMPPMKRAGRNLLLAVAGFGAATIVFGLSRNFVLSVAMLVLVGAFDNISVVVRHTLVQLLTPDEMRGRVSAVNQVFIGSSNELGGFESGLTAKLWGATTSVVVGGLGTIAVVAAVAWRFPQVRRLGALQDVKAEGGK